MQVQYDAGVRIQSDSWGYESSSTYTDTSSQVDAFTWLHPDFLTLFAAGNKAANTSSTNGPYDTYGLQPGGTVQSPANAKNTIAVGAVDTLVPIQEGSGVILNFRVTDPTSGEPAGPIALSAPRAVSGTSSSLTLPTNQCRRGRPRLPGSYSHCQL